MTATTNCGAENSRLVSEFQRRGGDRSAAQRLEARAVAESRAHIYEAIAEWASLRPRIRRIWASGGRFAVEPEPVADSEETVAVWIAHGERWCEELRTRIDPGIELAWFDPGGGALPSEETKLLIYEKGMG